MRSETSVTQPYDRAAWFARLPDDLDLMPKDKREATAEMLHGLCTYLNRVGHHRSRRPDVEEQAHQAMPIDQWEAEHVIAAAHLLLAFAIRELGAQQ
jgi:hypothetical protein